MKFIVKSPIKFGDERYEIDAEVEMSEKHAAPLLASGDLEAGDKKVKPEKKPGNQPGQE
jgi:hypothetical protein